MSKIFIWVWGLGLAIGAIYLILSALVHAWGNNNAFWRAIDTSVASLSIIAILLGCGMWIAWQLGLTKTRNSHCASLENTIK